MRNIHYTKKHTNANTQYVSISTADKKYLLDTLRRTKQRIDDCCDSTHPTISSIYELFNTNLTELPKRGVKPYGHNSINSYVVGILDNMNSNSQRDFSLTQLDGIQAIYKILNELFIDYELIEFVETNHPKYFTK